MQNDPMSVRGPVCAKIATIRVSSEGQEGLKSFLEKRPPQWRLGNSAP